MRYGSVNTWSKHLKEKERLLVSAETIRRKLKLINANGFAGRSNKGNASKNSFYSEDDVYLACAEFFSEIGRPNENGFIEIDGIRYATANTWSKELCVSNPTLRKRIKNSKTRSIKGRDDQGKIYKYYQEDQIRHLCSDLLEINFVANAEGYFEFSGEPFGSIKHWSRELGISNERILAKLKEYNVKGLIAKNHTGAVYPFYSYSDIKRVCAYLLEDRPQAGENGVLIIEGKEYLTIHGCGVRLNLSDNTIVNRIQKFKLTCIKGKNSGGRLMDYYCLEDIQNACIDINNDLPRANKEGCFVKNNKKYGNLNYWFRKTGLARATIKRKLKNAEIKGISGKDCNNHVLRNGFFTYEQVNSVCADLLATRQKSTVDNVSNKV